MRTHIKQKTHTHTNTMLYVEHRLPTRKHTHTHTPNYPSARHERLPTLPHLDDEDGHGACRNGSVRGEFAPANRNDDVDVGSNGAVSKEKGRHHVQVAKTAMKTQDPL